RERPPDDRDGVSCGRRRPDAALLRAPLRPRRARRALRPERSPQPVAPPADRALGRGEPALHCDGRRARAPDAGAARAALLSLAARRVDGHPRHALAGGGGGERRGVGPRSPRRARPRRDRARLRLADVLPRCRMSLQVWEAEVSLQVWEAEVSLQVWEAEL